MTLVEVVLGTDAQLTTPKRTAIRGEIENRTGFTVSDLGAARREGGLAVRVDVDAARISISDLQDIEAAVKGTFRGVITGGPSTLETVVITERPTLLG